jgi:hypothetical protein
MLKIKNIIYIMVLAAVLSCLPAKVVHASEEYIRLGDLDIGTYVVDSSWDWHYRPGLDHFGEGYVWRVVWIVAGKDHFTPSLQTYQENGIGHVVLLSMDNVARHTYDNSMNRDGWGQTERHGSNNWFMSGTYNATTGIRQFLKRVFLDAFSEQFRSALFPVDVPYVPLKRGPREGRPSYETAYSFSSYELVFILSETELGGDGNRTFKTGEVLDYFKSDAKTKRRARGPIDFYYTRSVDTHYRNAVRMVCSTGDIGFGAVFSGQPGIRPAVALRDDVLVKAVWDTKVQGIDIGRPVYEIYWPLNARRISLDKQELVLLLGQSQELKATLDPEDSTDEIYWFSTDERVATVDANGKIEAAAPGSAQIIAYASNPYYNYDLKEDIYTVCSVRVKLSEKGDLPSFSVFDKDVFSIIRKPFDLLDLDLPSITEILSKQESVTIGPASAEMEMIMDNVVIDVNLTEEVLVVEDANLAGDIVQEVAQSAVLEETVKPQDEHAKEGAPEATSLSEPAEAKKITGATDGENGAGSNEVTNTAEAGASIEKEDESHISPSSALFMIDPQSLLSGKMEGLMAEYGLAGSIFSRIFLGMISFFEKIVLQVFLFIERAAATLINII